MRCVCDRLWVCVPDGEGNEDTLEEPVSFESILATVQQVAPMQPDSPRCDGQTETVVEIQEIFGVQVSA